MTLLEVRAPTRSSSRLVALDVFRGATVAAMILVNNQGSGAHAFPGMAHAQWNGWNFADLVFPAFLFIVGTSLAFAADGLTHGRLARRTLILFALGLFLNGFPYGDWSDMRVMGVLQRIAIAYALGALMVLHTPVRKQVRVAGVALLAYWAMLLLPIPGVAGVHLSPALNVPGQVDRLVLGAEHVYKNGGYDPEGLLSTIPAVVTVLIGYWAGRFVRGRAVSPAVSTRLAWAGGACVVGGWAWGLLLPVNKRLWTPSFVVLTAGFSLLGLALCYWLVEVRGRRGWVLAVFGTNAIVVFLASEQLMFLLKSQGWRAAVYERVFAGFGYRLGSLLYGLTVTGLWWTVCWVLWRRRVFVKI